MEGIVVTSTNCPLPDELLAEQRELSAASRFSSWHDRHATAPLVRTYGDLIPLTKPVPGQQYGFEVDLDRCSGCKACVSACHSLNGLDDNEVWRDVGLLVSDDWRRPFQQTVTTACHHCVDPACLNGCPVLAYHKDPLTGIVRHLDDQCIGCQYCVLKCPYDAPKYSAQRGIVRKCDMCQDRLRVGEAPACAQACPTEAIRVTLLAARSVELEYRGRVGVDNPFLPATPAPDYTLPTTRYKTARMLPDSLRAADRGEIQPQPAHTSLAFMLVLSQLSVGLFTMSLVIGFMPQTGHTNSCRAIQALAALIAGLLALAISVGHLGRPWGAWRSFLGLRRSWLSREIVVFGCFISLAGLFTFAVWSPGRVSAPVQIALEVATVLSGLMGVFCSAMVYHDTRREFWRLPMTGWKFFGSTLILGSAGTLWVLLVRGIVSPVFVLPWTTLLALAVMFKLGLEHRTVRHRVKDDGSSLCRTALLLTERFGLLNRTRIACGVVGGIVLPALLAIELAAAAPGSGTQLIASILFVLCLAGELIERRLFFKAVQPVKMPGTIAS